METKQEPPNKPKNQNTLRDQKPEAPRYNETRERSLALYEEMRPYIEERQPGPMAVYVR